MKKAFQEVRTNMENDQAKGKRIIEKFDLDDVDSTATALHMGVKLAKLLWAKNPKAGQSILYAMVLGAHESLEQIIELAEALPEDADVEEIVVDMDSPNFGNDLNAVLEGISKVMREEQNVKRGN